MTLTQMEVHKDDNGLFIAQYVERDHIDDSNEEPLTGYGESEREAMLDLEVHYGYRKDYWLESIENLESLVDTKERFNSKFLLTKPHRNIYRLFFDAESGNIIYKDFGAKDVGKVTLPHDGISARITFNQRSAHYQKRNKFLGE